MACPPRSPAPLFQLDPAALVQLRDSFRASIALGLAYDGQRVAALPAWLPVPAAGLCGQALVVDLGGTNMRAAWVQLRAGGELRLLAGPTTAPVPAVGHPSLPADAFFDAQARLVAQLHPPPGLPVGYCFSFPAQVQPDGDALLLRWTKDIQVPGVQGQPVGHLLAAALQRCGVQIGSVRVLNDTVCALLAGAARKPTSAVIGLIVGTGTNMAAFFDGRRLQKLPGSAASAMAVNLESGNLELSHLTGWDLQIDATSSNPGLQGLEKAVSGRYLPQLLRAAAPTDLPPDLPPGAAALVQLRSCGPPEQAALAAAILDRSADLVACGLAAVTDLLPAGAVQVAAEGGLFWNAPGYAQRVRASLDSLLDQPGRVSLLRLHQANLLGAAAAALGPTWSGTAVP